MKRLTTALLISVSVLFHTAVHAMTIDCRLRSFDDGSELRRLRVSIEGDFVAVFERTPVTLKRRISEVPREVQFHHYSNPIEVVRRKERRLAQPHSVLVLKKMRHTTEVGPDILVVDWGKGKLKSSSAYDREFVTNWHCTRHD